MHITTKIAYTFNRCDVKCNNIIVWRWQQFYTSVDKYNANDNYNSVLTMMIIMYICNINIMHCVYHSTSHKHQPNLHIQQTDCCLRKPVCGIWQRHSNGKRGHQLLAADPNPQLKMDSVNYNPPPPRLLSRGSFTFCLVKCVACECTPASATGANFILEMANWHGHWHETKRKH